MIVCVGGVSLEDPEEDDGASVVLVNDCWVRDVSVTGCGKPEVAAGVRLVDAVVDDDEAVGFVLCSAVDMDAGTVLCGSPASVVDCKLAADGAENCGLPDVDLKPPSVGSVVDDIAGTAVGLNVPVVIEDDGVDNAIEDCDVISVVNAAVSVAAKEDGVVSSDSTVADATLVLVLEASSLVSGEDAVLVLKGNPGVVRLAGVWPPQGGGRAGVVPLSVEES